MFNIVVSAADAAVKEKETITQGRVGLQCRFRFSPEWKGLAKTAVFAGAEDRDVIITGDTVTVPAECLSEANRPLWVGVFGKSGDGTVVIPTVCVQLGQIEPGACPGGKEPAAPTPDVVAQIQQAAANAEAMARSVRDDADLGKFTGPAGEPGGWYTPEIKQPIKGAMVVNFTPSKEGMPETEAKSIILPQGDAGADGGYYTPAVTQPDENTMHVEFTPSKADMPAVDPTDITLPAGGGGGSGEDGADGKSAYEYAVEGGYTGTEAEFAQKLAQEKYASPNALTFTGAVEGSYDGSEAVTVEIPSGGGIENAQLLVDFTTEADVTSFTVASSDPDTDYRGIIFLLKTISTSSNSAVRAISVGVNAYGGSFLVNMSQNVEGRIGYAIGFINLQGNPAFGAVLHSLNGANGIISTSTNYSIAPYYKDNEAPCKFKKIFVSTQNSANTMLTGTSIQVWGVK